MDALDLAVAEEEEPDIDGGHDPRREPPTGAKGSSVLPHDVRPFFRPGLRYILGMATLVLDVTPSFSTPPVSTVPAPASTAPTTKVAPAAGKGRAKGGKKGVSEAKR